MKTGSWVKEVLAPHAASPPSTGLRQSFVVLVKARKAASQRQASESMRERANKLNACEGAIRAKATGKLEKGINIYKYLNPGDVGLILERAVKCGDWTIAEHVLKYGGENFESSLNETESVIMRCCRQGKPELASAILQKLLARVELADPPPSISLSLCSSAASAYIVLLRALGKSGRWEACVELLKRPSLPLALSSEACFEAGINACGRQQRIDEALDLLEHFRRHCSQKDILKSSSCYNAAIKACARVGAFGRARDVIEEARRDGLQPSLAAFNAILETCSRLGAWDEGSKVLVDMRQAGVDPNEDSYAFTIRACVALKQWKQALFLLRSMKDHGVFPNEHCYIAAIESCCRGGQWHSVVQLLDGMRAKGLEAPESVYLVKILPALSRAGRWRECSDTLDRMKRQGLRVPLEAHRLVLLGYRRSGQWQKALKALRNLRHLGLAPSLSCYEIVLDCCAQGRRWMEAKELFAEIEVETPTGPSLTCFHSMLQLCGKTGRWSEALQLWSIVHREHMLAIDRRGNRPSQSAAMDVELVSGCLKGALMACQQASQWTEALSLLKQEEERDQTSRVLRDMNPETMTQCYALTLAACAKAGEWECTTELLRRTPRPDEACYEAVLEACARRGRWEECLALLRELRSKVSKEKEMVLDAGMYQLAMWGCINAGRAEEAVALMEEMVACEGLVPTARTYVTYLKALQRQKNWQKSVRALMQGRRENVLVLKENSDRTASQELLAWTTVLQTCGRAGQWQEVLDILCESSKTTVGGSVGSEVICRRGVPLTVVEVLLGTGRLREAIQFLEGLAKDVGVIPPLPVINRLLGGLGAAGEWSLCLELLLGVDGAEDGPEGNSMKARFHVSPDVACFTVVMGAAAAGLANEGRHGDCAVQELAQLLPVMRSRFGLEPDLRAYNVAANLHRRAGDLAEVLKILEDMKQNKSSSGIAPDVVTYSTALAACGEAGKWEKALSLLKEMSSLGVQPNVVAYTAAISACGKGGQAAFALGLFQEMKMNNVALNVQCCNTLLWALSKGGDWRQCLLLLEEMESDASMRIKPDADTYRIVMQALRDQEVQKDLTKRLHEGLAQLTAESGKPGTQ